MRGGAHSATRGMHQVTSRELQEMKMAGTLQRA